MKEGPAFQGLVTGDQAILAIGEERMEKAQQQIALKVLWVGLVEIRSIRRTWRE